MWTTRTTTTMRRRGWRTPGSSYRREVVVDCNILIGLSHPLLFLHYSNYHILMGDCRKLSNTFYFNVFIRPRRSWWPNATRRWRKRWRLPSPAGQWGSFESSLVQVFILCRRFLLRFRYKTEELASKLNCAVLGVRNDRLSSLFFCHN